MPVYLQNQLSPLPESFPQSWLNSPIYALRAPNVALHHDTELQGPFNSSVFLIKFLSSLLISHTYILPALQQKFNKVVVGFLVLWVTSSNAKLYLDYLWQCYVDYMQCWGMKLQASIPDPLHCLYSPIRVSKFYRICMCKNYFYSKINYTIEKQGLETQGTQVLNKVRQKTITL